MAQFVAKELGKELKYTMHDNPNSRPGHDLRYALDGDKLRELGWKLPLTFFDSLRKTIRWMVQNPEWLDPKNFGTEFGADGRAGEMPPPVARAGVVAPGASVKQTVVDRVSGASGRDSQGGAVAAKAKL